MVVEGVGLHPAVEARGQAASSKICCIDLDWDCRGLRRKQGQNGDGFVHRDDVGHFGRRVNWRRGPPSTPGA